MLYRVAAEWMLANDLNLYASDLQSPNGEAIWKKLEEEGWGLYREPNPLIPNMERVCIETPEPGYTLTPSHKKPAGTA